MPLHKRDVLKTFSNGPVTQDKKIYTHIYKVKLCSERENGPGTVGVVEVIFLRGKFF